MRFELFDASNVQVGINIDGSRSIEIARSRHITEKIQGGPKMAPFFGKMAPFFGMP